LVGAGWIELHVWGAKRIRRAHLDDRSQRWLAIFGPTLFDVAHIDRSGTELKHMRSTLLRLQLQLALWATWRRDQACCGKHCAANCSPLHAAQSLQPTLYGTNTLAH